MRYRRILVATDFSQYSTVAAQWAARAFAPRAELVLVHVLELPPPRSFLPRRVWLRADDVERYRADAATRLRQLGTQIGPAVLQEVVRIGRPDEEVLRIADQCDADLVVVGSHRERPAFWNRFGSTAERILAGAKVPVLVVHGAPRDLPRRLLAAVDDSAAADEVIEHAKALAERFRASGKILHVLPSASSHQLAAAGELVVTNDPVLDVGNEVIDASYRWLSDRIGEKPDELTPAVGLGPVKEVILSQARSAGAQLIVMGRERQAAIRRHPLGSVTSTVLRAATCPVLVVPTAGRAHAYPSAERPETSSLARRAPSSARHD